MNDIQKQDTTIRATITPVIIDARMKGGILLFTGSVQFTIALTLAEALYPNYDVSSNPLSDLGAGIFQPSSNIFNGSVIIFGCLILLSTYFIKKGFDAKPLITLLLLSGIGVLGVGLFTESILVPHLVFSLIAFLFSALAAIFSFKAVDSPFRYFCAVLGIAALLAIVLFIAEVDFGLGHGGIQRMIVYPALLWYISFGSHIMTHSPSS